MDSDTILDTTLIPWENGLQVLDKMTPKFRSNLGPREEIADTFEKYWQKSLHQDESNTRRIDLVYLDEGYRDLTYAYHDSVEECYVLKGDLQMGGEGELRQGDYFWRPPGFVHATQETTGFYAILGFQGVDKAEASGAVTRHIRPQVDRGINFIYPDNLDLAVGPRGWIRRLPAGIIAWQRSPNIFTNIDFLDSDKSGLLETKILSVNYTLSGATILLRLLPGYSVSITDEHASPWELFILDGELNLDDYVCTAEHYIRLSRLDNITKISSESGSIAYVKIDSMRT